VALLLGLLLPALGCSDGPRPGPHAVRLEHVRGRPFENQYLDERVARALVTQVLDASPSFRAARAGESALEGTLAYEVTVDDGGTPFLLLFVHFEAPAGLRKVFPSGLGVPVSLERTDQTIVLERDLELAAQKAAIVLEAQLALGRNDPGALQRLLGSEDPELVLLGLGWVHDHPDPKAADAVAALLEHEDDRVSLLAIECLGMIGGPRHAEALVRSVRLGDTAQAHRTYEALASLGGPRAREFLEFAARNEDDPRLAAAAIRALEQILDESSGPQPGNVRRGHRK
jgi:hypothetical protein